MALAIFLKKKKEINVISCFFSGSNNVGELFNMAGQVGKAVGTLVTVMTDENGDAIEDADVILEDSKQS